MNTTIEYFDQNAERCFADAFTITERTNQDHFLSYVRPGGSILDFARARPPSRTRDMPPICEKGGIFYVRHPADH